MSLELPPEPEDIEVFEVPPGVFINMGIGCWHAGPMFLTSSMDFYNLVRNAALSSGASSGSP